jgi:hypothetical protein
VIDQDAYLEVYKGSWCNGAKDGPGELVWVREGSWYKGDWAQGLKHGLGELYSAEGDHYAGGFYMD